MSEFLPEGYEAPQGGSAYTKIQDGENKIRILSKPVLGWLGWENKVAHRFRMNQKPEKKFDQPLKHFWAFLVWNYNENAIQIMEITQATIQRSIADLSKNEDWGPPFEYDIKIFRKGKDLSTEYSVMPSPKKPITDEIKKAGLDRPAYLEALFDGGDPWTVTTKQTELYYTDLPF